MNVADAPQVSVVVPTRARPAPLRRCLAALAAQTLEPLEVIVAEDEAGEGPAAARNAGVRAARGDVVLFTDDDCEPEAGWAEALAAAVLESGVACGRTLPAPGGGAAVVASQAITNHLQAWAQRPGSPSAGFAPTSNLGARRSLLADLPFDEAFPAAAGEDRDWAERAASRGLAPRFTPAAVVLHRPELGPAAFLRQQLRYGRGAARYRRSAPGGRPIGSPRFYASLAAAGFREGPGPGSLVAAAQVAVAAGVAAERASALKERLAG
jgi:GT2 family glycosyltransferase